MKKALLLLCLAGLAIIAAACGGGNTTPAGPNAQGTPAAGADIPARPAIALSVLGQSYDGLPGAYCWLQAADDIRCEPDPLDLQPEPVIEVAPGDTLTFSVASDETPALFHATFLDDTDANGEPLVVPFGMSASGDYEVDLAAGTHRIRVMAEYPEIGGDNSFVSAIFAVEVPADAVAAVQTPDEAAPTDDMAADMPTETMDETDEAMDDDATAEPTDADEMDMAEPTEGAATDMTEPTADDAQAAVATAEPTGEDMQAPTPEDAIEPGDDATDVPDAADTDATTPDEDAASPTPADNDMAELATDTPVPTEMPPPATPEPTAAPAEAGDVPAVVVVRGARHVPPSGVQVCVVGEDCVDIPAATESERITITSGDTVRVDAPDTPQVMTVRLTDSTQAETFYQAELSGNSTAISLHVFSGDPGNYLLVVETVWPDNRVVTYFFRLQILA